MVAILAEERLASNGKRAPGIFKRDLVRPDSSILPANPEPQIVSRQGRGSGVDRGTHRVLFSDLMKMTVWLRRFSR